MSDDENSIEGFDATSHALKNAYGPCLIPDCHGVLRRVGVAHGSDVFECDECDLRTTSTGSGN